jgi:hypothetical protein
MASHRGKRGRLFYLLVFLVLFMVLYSFSARSIIEQLILNLILVGLLISVVVMLRQTARSLLVSLLLGVPWLVAVFVDLFIVKENVLSLATTLAGIPFLLFVTWTVFMHIAKARKVTADTIYGAICVYMLLGIIWAAGYRFLEALNPGSLSGPIGINPETGVEIPNYIYFSFTTLTTLGYGDIIPVSSPARALAILEAVAGPLYITILISQLVSKYVKSTGRVESDHQ